MKKLAKDFYKKLLVIILLLVFLIGNNIIFMNKKTAQSSFARNTLSFLLLSDNYADFKSNIENFNKTHNQTISYRDDKNSSRKPVVAYTSEISRNVKLDGLFNYRANYYFEEDNRLVLSIPYNLSFYINWPLLIGTFLIGILAWIYADRKLDEDIDKYIENIKATYASDSIKLTYNDEMRPVIKSYRDDINFYKNEANELSERLDEFRNITSNMKEGFIIFDGKGNIDLINAAARKYLNVDVDRNIDKLIDDKEYSLALREAKILKRSKILDIKLNGYFLRIFIDPLQTATSRAFAMIIIDNTEDKKAEQMRREFSANVTHELKSPLTSINGYAELIATGIAKEDDITKFAEIIYDEGNRLLAIIDDILKISRLDENNHVKDFVEVDIYEVVDKTIKKYKRQTDHKDISIENKVRPYRIKTSGSLFHDLVSNLYENAIKYNTVGGSIIIDYELRDNCYFLSIKDTGIGMSTYDLNRIFERFYVADKSRKRNQKSTGLGLSIVKHIVNYLGYDIKVKSELGKGSEFIIQIPLALDR